MVPAADEGDLRARVGEWTRVLARPEVLEDFAATLGERLEPGGRGTRFPLLVDHLLAGRLEASEAAGALAELEVAARELAALPPSKSVAPSTEPWSAGDRGDAGGAEAGGAAVDFVDRAGRPLVEALREAIEECGRSGFPLTVDAGPVQGGARRGALLAMAGGILTAAGLLVFPDVVARSAGGEEGHGLPLWTFGLILAAAGLWELALGRSPVLAALARRRPFLPVLLGLALLAVVAYLSYR